MKIIKDKLNESKKFERRKKLIQILTVFSLLISPVFLKISIEAMIIYVSIDIIVLLILSHIVDASIPYVGNYLETKYFHNKLKILEHEDNDEKLFNAKLFFRELVNKVIYYSIILFKSSRGSFRIIREKVFVTFEESMKKDMNDGYNLFKANEILEKMKKQERLTLAQIEDLESIIYDFYKKIRRRVAVFSLSGLTVMVFSVVIVSTITSMIFTEVTDIEAASYTYTQTDWSGGVNASAEATHPGDATGWTEFQSGAGVDTSNNELKLERTISIN